jgi:hypothetical protein
MGFGAIIASGEKNKILRDDLLDSITEVRVEQFLDEPTRFAIRFQEDICNGELTSMKSPELQCDQMITIAVQVGDVMKCLVRGPITDVKSSFQLGGPGSWHQIYGQDRRVRMDRERRFKAWSGEASQVADTILDTNNFKSKNVEQIGLVYGGTREAQQETVSTLNQRESDLAFLLRIARDYGLNFWIEYTCRRNRLDPSGQSLQVEEQANLKSSPPRPQGAPPGPIPVDQIKLVATANVALRVNVEKQRGPNVTAFDLTMDPERPNRFAGAAIDDTNVQRHTVTPSDPQPPIVKGGRRLADSKQTHDLYITTAGNQEELQRKAAAALIEAGWFVDATTSTTAHMLCDVLVPHDVVAVEGLGNVHDGPYQVKAVTHVITPADHLMDIHLRRNAIGGG